MSNPHHSQARGGRCILGSGLRRRGTSNPAGEGGGEGRQLRKRRTGKGRARTFGKSARVKNGKTVALRRMKKKRK